MRKYRNTQSFIDESNFVHNFAYDYSEAVFLGIKSPVDIICKKHGKFTQIAVEHLKGHKCKPCGIEQRIITKQISGEKNFITKSKAKHNNKYDYSRVIFISQNKEVIIICPIHGEFKQRPNLHLQRGCKHCSFKNKKRSAKVKNNKIYTTESFILECSVKHNNKYDYSETVFDKTSKVVKIICSIHGEFYQKAFRHLEGVGCRPCCMSVKGLKSLEKHNKLFAAKANKKHINKYNYSLANLIHEMIVIICPEHEEFIQSKAVHLRGCGCPQCYAEKSSNRLKFTEEKFREKLKECARIHNFKFDYSNTFHVTEDQKLHDITCPVHGYFKQKLTDHLNGFGCIKCAGLEKLTYENFVGKANSVHNYKYDYSKFIYSGSDAKGIIICSIHGEFTQIANDHLGGHGCKNCSKHVSQKEAKWLDNLNIPKEKRNITIKINNKIFYPDATDKENKIIYEFYGDFWHGNPDVYSHDTINKVRKTTFGELYHITMKRKSFIEQHGYKVVFIWEHDWDLLQKMSNNK